MSIAFRASPIGPASTREPPARTVQFLQLTGHLEIIQAGSDKLSTYTSAEDEVVREVVALHAKLIFELIAPIIALDGPDAVAGRLNRILEESAERGRPLLDRVRFSPAATLDPSELEHRALRLTGDRVREVDEAPGEIISYLEFELKNHPQIDDCSPLLEAVDPLRAMLIR